jgi:hypothetical protein
LATIDPKLDSKSPKFNIKAYKHAISMIESSGGKFMEAGRGKNGKLLSSAAGKYHFLYKLIQKDPEMKGVTKRQFMNNDKLQDRIMDKALNGNLAGFTYGTKYAEKLKSEYGSDHDVTSLTALIHFLGPGNARKYLKNPDTFIVPGTVNSTAGDYLKNFNKHFDKYNTDNPVNDTPQINNTKIPQVVTPTAPKAGVPAQGIQGTNPPSVSISQYPDTEFSYDFNEFKQGGKMSPEGSELDGMSGANKLVTVFEGGGTHEQNSLGGIPQGIGSNGKPNLVEEGETKWNDYIFSNAYDMEGNYTGDDGKKSNVFEGGGELSGSSCGGPGQPPCDENYNEKIRNSRGGNTTYVTGEQGNYEFFDEPQYTDHEPSTHLMSDDNIGEAWPAIARNSKGEWVNQSQEEARKNKETYSFGNKEDLFKFAREGSWKSNSFEKGGNLIDPTDPSAAIGLAPNEPTPAKNVLSFLDNEYLPTPQPQEKKKDLKVYDNLAFPMAKMDEFGLTKNKVKIKDQREGHMKYDAGLGVLQNPTQSVDFDSLITNDIHKYVDGKPTVEKTGTGTAKAFLNRYNDPITRKRMKDQAGFTDEDIDNMIIRGLKAEKHDGGNPEGSNAAAWTVGGKDQIFFGKEHLHNKATETHERIHASKMDEPMGLVLQEVLGDANNQKRGKTTRDGTEYIPQQTRDYLNRPGEAYGNFAGFREELGLKPGEQIDVPTLQRLIKEKKIESNFNNVYDDDKIVKALNTIAYQGKSNNNNNNNQEYKLS